MNSKYKGSLAAAQCIAKLYSLGYEVLLPIGDRKCYDLVFDNGKKLLKVQAKYAGRNSRNKCIAALRITGGNQSFNYTRKYLDDDFDYLYVYTETGNHFLIKWSDIQNRNEVSVECEKYKKYLI
jgi:hypothetical protein